MLRSQRRTPLRSQRIAGLLTLALAASAWHTAADAADRDALLHIVQDQCLPHWREQQDAAPCVRVIAPDFAVLADRKGGAHFLLIATQTVRGIEDPAILRPDAPNYFAAAWEARDRLAVIAGHPVPDDAVGLAINSALARGQDQLHIHIECLQPGLRRLLHTVGSRVGDRWAPLPGAPYPFLARRVRGGSLAAANPFQLLAEGRPEARQNMGSYTIVVAGVRLRDGPGFIVLAGRTPTNAALLLPTAARGLVPPGETLLDSTCPAEP